MSSKLSRFLHLEKDRGERAKRDVTPQLQDGGRRFEDIAERGALPQGDVPEAHLERFKAQPPMVLEQRPDTTEDDGPDFPRCVVCASDNGRYAKHCQQCGADLGTPEQLEYREQRAREQREQRAKQRGVEREDGLQRLEQERREDAERYAFLLQKLREEEQQHGAWRIFARHSTVGTGLLALLPSTLARCLVVVGYVGLSFGLIRLGQGSVRGVGIGMLCFLSLLFTPWRARFRRWR
ncbi:hypothetical protein ACN469_38445 [Corallococcus terminator]